MLNKIIILIKNSKPSNFSFIFFISTKRDIILKIYFISQESFINFSFLEIKYKI